MHLLLAALVAVQEPPPGRRFDLTLGKLFVPAHFKAGPTVDLLVHFHGSAAVVEREFARAGKNTALVTIHVGAGSSVYVKAMSDPAALQAVIDEACSKIAGAKPGRLYLSSFSAGYGAIREILKSKRYDVAWLLLADSLHAGYEERRPRADQMEPFVAYARSGKPMWVTHSAIVPGDYASTTETADALLGAVEARRERADEKNARGMRLTSKADRGELHVRGYEGADGPAHLEHLQNLGEYFARMP
jgi:hypothetical protein